MLFVEQHVDRQFAAFELGGGNAVRVEQNGKVIAVHDDVALDGLDQVRGRLRAMIVFAFVAILVCGMVVAYASDAVHADTDDGEFGRGKFA